MDMDLEEHYDKIYRYCYFKLHQQQAAEDITQETFLRFLESETYRKKGKALQYLYTVARNLCIDEYRKKRQECLPEELAGEDTEERLLTSVAVKTALEELSGEDRELILLRYVNEVPAAVIGRLLGMSRFAVYRRTKGILAILEKKLGREDFL